MTSVTTAPAGPAGRVLVKRHSLLVRITHWINALAIFFLVLSGLQVFNAHPALYIGQKSDFENPVLSMSAFRLNDGLVVGETSGISSPAASSFAASAARSSTICAFASTTAATTTCCRR